ncbi:MAG: hypothetical protein ACI8YQ_003456 [Polaribacter sp.]|jgi:hypothetical protein
MKFIRNTILSVIFSLSYFVLFAQTVPISKITVKWDEKGVEKILPAK